MDQVQQFLDTSTIHGLSWISRSQGLKKLFWILVVLVGFSGATYLIYQSFNNWKSSPISTTVETLPISEITLPNITVCPPRDSLLNLNYDIIQAEKILMNDSVRTELLDYAHEIIQYEYFEEIMTNMSKLREENKSN